MNEKYLYAYSKALEKVRYMKNEFIDFPHITKDGQWRTYKNGHWTGGFWVGLLWFDALATNRDIDRNIASTWAKRFKSRISDNKTHDMGFIFGPSCMMGHRINQDNEFLELVAFSANNMKDLYEEKVGLILAWDEPGYEGMAIVDTIMNLPLMVLVADQEGDETLREIAHDVAEHIVEFHIREDASIYHMVKWDTDSYKIIEQTTHQGYASDTCWSRGQAWALYGFANMYRYTSKRKYLETSMKLAEYYWSHLDSETLLPRWDFVFRNNDEEPIDSAAASIGASGMLLLSDMLSAEGLESKARIWLERGMAITDSLIEYCLYSSLDKYGIIEKGTVDKPRKSGIGESTMYGDYYFTEALYRILNRDNRDMLNLLY